MAIHPSTLALINEADSEQIPMLKSLAQGMTRLSIKHDGPMTDETEGYHREFIEAIINDEAEDITAMGENTNESVRRACSVGYVALWKLTKSKNYETSEMAQETIGNFLQRFQESDDPNVSFHAGFFEYDWMGSRDLAELEEQYTQDDLDLLRRGNKSLTEDELNSLFPNGKHSELERFIQRNPNFPLVILAALYGKSETVLGKKPEYWHMFVMHVRSFYRGYSFQKKIPDLL